MRRKRYTITDKVKVIFRKDEGGEVVAFLPELPAARGNIVCYAHIGQHGEASMDYYNSTQTASPEEYNALYEELKAVYNDIELSVKKRIYRGDLEKAWRRSE